MIRCISPADNKVYLERKIAAASEIESALSSASIAVKQWKKIPLTTRQEICQKAVEYFINHADEIAGEISWQMGRPITQSPSEILGGFRERAEHMIRISREALADIRVAMDSTYQRYIKKVPLGTVLVLAPWNYPYLTSVNAIIPAILAGNSVILKPSAQTPLCAERYAKAFEAAGMPIGVFQFLHLSHQQVHKLVVDRRINYVAFTGSVPGGRAIKAAIAKRFINAGLELGGKDPAYVCADAPLGYTISNLVDGAFFNSGQSCCGIERIYVDKKCFPDFVEGFVEQTKKYRLGHPLDADVTLGPMVRTSSADFVRSQINQAVASGATKLLDEGHFPNSQQGTPYLAPQVLTKVDHSMDLMQIETFGPVVGIMPVKTDEEAIKLMNDSLYGLTASIWTRDRERAKKIGDELETGTVFMNRCDYLDPALAWTGVRDSGVGVTLSSLGFDQVTRPQSFHLKSLG